MNYTIEMKNDLMQGSVVVIKIPLDTVDIISLETIASSPPSFLIPFQHRIVDQEVELLYAIKTCTPLKYLKETKDVLSYVEFWNDVLEPLISCDDWFMNHFCFLLDINQIFLDSKSGRVCYLYVPVKENIGSMDELQKLMVEISKVIRPQDLKLENAVLRELQAFQPTNFLEMLKNYRSSNRVSTPPKTQAIPRQAPTPEAIPKPVVKPKIPVMPKATMGKKQEMEANKEKIMAAPSLNEPLPPYIENSAGIKPQSTVDMPFQNLIGGNFEFEAVPKKTGGLFGNKEVKKAKALKELKDPKESKGKREGFSFKKDKAPQGEMLGGVPNFQDPQAYQPPPKQYQTPLPMQNAVAPQASNFQVQAFEEMEDGMTQIPDEEEGDTSAVLRKIGVAPTPEIVTLAIVEGVPYTIGRFDVTKGVQQNDFEFAKDTRGVSRRHCVIEKKNGAFHLIDLGSKGGTSLNGEKLAPNIPHFLKSGDQISFGFSGVDYVFQS